MTKKSAFTAETDWDKSEDYGDFLDNLVANKKITLRNMIVQAYGSLAAESAAASQAMSSAFAKLTCFDTDGAAYNAVPAHGDDIITIDKAGVYEVYASMTVEIDAAKELYLQLGVNGVADSAYAAEQNIPSTGVPRIITLPVRTRSFSAADQVSLMGALNSGVANLTVTRAALYLKRIEGA